MPSRRAALIVAGCFAASVIAIAGRYATRAHERPVRLLFTGDILLARQVAVEIAATHHSPWDSLTKLLAGANWVEGNFEGAIGTESNCAVQQGAPCFAALDTAPALLTRAGFKAVSIENNHAGDVGAEGRPHTRSALRAAGILGLDFEQSPQFARFGDVTVAMIAVSLERAADGQVQTIPSVVLAQKLRLARTLANIVVVSIHWGTELQDWPNTAQRIAAEWLIDRGADVIVGHHPHVVQRPECIRGRPVFFSLGNHVFDQRYPETKEGLIADCRILNEHMRCSAVPTHTRRGSAFPVVVGVGDDSLLETCTVPLGRTLSMAGVALRPAPWSASNDSAGVVLEGWKGGAKRWQTRRVSLVSLQSGLEADGKEPLLFALERHPSQMDGEAALRPHVYGVNDHGLIAKWRGTALAWPLIDAVVDAGGQLCALHRGDSFLRPDLSATSTRMMRYRWNGFGFSALNDNDCKMS